MPLNAINYVLTKSVLDRAVGERPTDEQKSEINRAAAISAFVPGTLGLAVPFITRDRIAGEDEGNGEEGEGRDGGNGKDVAAALASLQKSVEANTRDLGTIQADLKGLRRDVDELKAAAKKPG